MHLKNNNEWADFWYYQIGANVIPADTRNKRPIVKWTPFQDRPISKEQHEEWKEQGAFKDGMAIIAGKVWHNDSKKNLYLILVDLDNQKAIDEFCTRNGVKTPLSEFAKTLIVEQHKDQTDKAHIIFYASHPFQKKSSDIAALSTRLDSNQVPALEVKGAGEHGLLYCTPSPHKNGHNYEIIGTTELDGNVTYDIFESHIDNICSKYGIPYLNGNGNGNGNNSTPIQDLFREDTKIYEGHNRHEALLRVMESLLSRNHAILTEAQIKQLAAQWNQQHCIPPLDERNFDKQWNDAVKFIQQHNQEKQQQEETTSNTEDEPARYLNESLRPRTVLEAKRIHGGEVNVLGTIVSVSEMYVVEVPDSIIYKDAKSIQLEDTERPDENERLDVVLYDDDISNVRAGEVVEIKGTMRIESKKGNKSKKLINVLHAHLIKYLNRQELVITQTDIKNFYQFASKPILIDRLVSMFAPNIIGHDHAKLGILRSIAGGVERGKTRARINTFMVGDPGTAKSTLAREAVDVKPNSRYVSGPHSSAKTITAIMDKENDGLVLRLGAIPLSRGGICAVNEITEFQLEDQARLLDVLEEGIIPLNKHGTHMIIQSPTTIIATANPIQSSWNDLQKVSNDEIPMLRTLLDRFDQIYPFRDNMGIEETQKFVDQMNVIRKRRPHNYNFLKKYLIYASGIEVQITSEAEFMLNQFWIHAKVQRTLTIRGYNSLFRIAEAQAKLQLKNLVDVDIATQTMETVQLMMVQYGETVKTISNPKDTILDAFLGILEETQGPIDIKELCEMACKRDVHIRAYLGGKYSTSNNWKLREVIKLLLNNGKVKQISAKPLVLQWLFDVYDVFEGDQLSELSNEPRDDETNAASYTSNTSNRKTDVAEHMDRIHHH